MKNCLACCFRRWKLTIANCIWELKALNKPVIEIEKTKKFSVLSIIH